MPTISAQRRDAGQEALVACGSCDALMREIEPPPGTRSRCPRCRAPTASGGGASIDGALAIAAAAAVLLAVAPFLPFMSLFAAGLRRDAAVLDAAAAAGGALWPLTAAVGAMIVAIPLTRALALIWALAPLRFLGAPAPGARPALRLATALRPWSMAEVFVVGVVVALVKIADLAIVEPGAAFWAFGGIAILAFLEDGALSRSAIWRRLG